jgi:hypothetical protein
MRLGSGQAGADLTGSNFAGGVRGGNRQVREVSAEGFDGLCRDLVELDKRWDDRLRVEELNSFDHYLAGRFSLVAHISYSGRGLIENDRRSVRYRGLLLHLHHAPALNVDDALPAKNCGWCHNQKVVLLPVIQLVESGEHSATAAVPILVSAYINQELDCITSGGLYRRVRDHAFHALSIGRDWQAVLCACAFCADETHPCAIQRAAQVGADISRQQSDRGWCRVGNATADLSAPGFRIELHPRGEVRLGIQPAGDVPLEIVEQYAGPFNL